MDDALAEPDARLKAIEDRLDRLAIRTDAVEGMFFTITERIVASLSEAETREVLDDLRANILVGEATLSGSGEPWDRAERAVLETEAYATRLLDQIQKSAETIRSERTKPPAGN